MVLIGRGSQSPRGEGAGGSLPVRFFTEAEICVHGSLGKGDGDSRGFRRTTNLEHYPLFQKIARCENLAPRRILVIYCSILTATDWRVSSVLQDDRVATLCQGVDFTFLSGVQGWNPWLGLRPHTPFKPKSMGWCSMSGGTRLRRDKLEETKRNAVPFCPALRW
jgi:hypothetical protein